ncbi:hypothetical protein B0T16DRAFT_416954 [Cercophora newfieldiana]|uniref:RING-type E3 ubiquitin transferase n=1 Tax=Cercophora newfieldiana TaxID=92897 RepID=A0AA39Y0Y4_9PEZI|nr:hypothetical protein B0T16DRAFT_416954 [Cercophora newfieldiana]
MDRAITLPWRPAAAQAPKGWQANAPCKFFAQGKCRNGQACSFSHGVAPESCPPASTVQETPATSADAGEGDTRKQVQCRFYASGGCLKGVSCPFAHVDADGGVEGGGARDVDTPEMDEIEPEDTPDDWIREIGGAAVQFGDGAAVLKVSLQSDFSAVRIRMLPSNSDQAGVSKFLCDLGFEVSTDNIRVLPAGDQTHCAADVRVEDPSFAKRLFDAVDTKSAIKVDIVNAPMPNRSGFQRVECKKVYCSWHRPLRTVWLNFKTKKEASAAHSAFSSGSYKVCDATVKSHGVKGSPNAMNPQPWTVMLTEVPAGATKDDINQPIPPRMRPAHVELGKPSFVYDMATANALVKSKLMEIGALDWWEDAAKNGGKRAKARGRFRDEGVASKAAASLNGWTLPLGRGLKLRLDMQAIYSARFRVAERIFKVVKPVIDVQVPSWLAKHVFLTAYDVSRTNGHRVLRLEGESQVAVAEAKGALEKILAGEVAMDGTETIWTPAFAVNGGVFLKLKQMEETLGIAIVRNKRRSCLHLFGPPEKCKEAQPLLAKLAKEDTSTTHTIDLFDDQFTWARLGGFNEMRQALGRKVTFDSISTPKRIIVTGSEKDYLLALSMLATTTTTPTPTPDTAATLICPICFTPPEDPITTPCTHTYCTDCFEHFCSAGLTSTSLLCASSSCNTPLPLSSLQSHLPTPALEKLLSDSFTSYIRQRPSTFRYCGTPDCNQVYRVSSSATPGSEADMFTCPRCLTTVCTKCRDSHPGMTCAEHADIKSGGYAALEETKRKLGIKDCPRCKTSIEKIDGCNHVTCLGCQAHICWKCLGTFGSSRGCYDHLSLAHGGVFDRGYGM